MSKRWMINFGLIALILLFTYIGNNFDLETGKRIDQPGDVDQAVSVDPASIASISMRTATGELAFTRAGDTWMLSQPIRWPAHRANLDRVLDVTQVSGMAPLPSGDGDLDQFGLQFPQALLQFGDTPVRFGASNNIGERRYVMIGEAIYLLPDRHLPFINQGLLGFVDRRLLPAELGLMRLELPDLTIRAAGGDGWQIDGDEGLTPAQAEGLVANWRQLEAARVKPYQSSLTPRQKILAEIPGDEQIEFFVLSIDPEIIIANPRIGLQYHFSTDYYYQLISLRADETPA